MKKLLLGMMFASGNLGAAQQTPQPKKPWSAFQQLTRGADLEEAMRGISDRARQPQNQGDMGEHPIVIVTAGAAFAAILWMVYMVFGKSFAR